MTPLDNLALPRLVSLSWTVATLLRVQPVQATTAHRLTVKATNLAVAHGLRNWWGVFELIAFFVLWLTFVMSHYPAFFGDSFCVLVNLCFVYCFIQRFSSRYVWKSLFFFFVSSLFVPLNWNINFVLKRFSQNHLHSCVQHLDCSILGLINLELRFILAASNFSLIIFPDLHLCGCQHNLLTFVKFIHCVLWALFWVQHPSYFILFLQLLRDEGSGAGVQDGTSLLFL